MLPIAVTALDMMFVLSFLHERNKDAQVMIEFFKAEMEFFHCFVWDFLTSMAFMCWRITAVIKCIVQDIC